MSQPPYPTRDSFREKVYDPSYRPLIMGIINATPDSFYSPSAVQGVNALSLARTLIAEGADILDIGGESTRPGSAYVSEQEEMDRVLPIVESIRQESDIPISVDTRKFRVAEAAVAFGINCVNDIAALVDNPDLGRLIADHNLAVVLMHMQGNPQTMQEDPSYHNVVQEVQDFLQQRIDYAQSIGISPKQIIVDPGIGFGKTHSHNLQLLRNLESIVALGFPLLLGLSRKSFIGKILAQADERLAKGAHLNQIRATQQRLYGSLAAVADSYVRGSRIFRVHDVAETRDLLETMHHIRAQ